MIFNINSFKVCYEGSLTKCLKDSFTCLFIALHDVIDLSTNTL